MDTVNAAEANRAAWRNATEAVRQSQQRQNFVNRAAGLYPGGPAPAVNAGYAEGADDALQRVQALLGVFAMFALTGLSLVFLPYLAYSLGSGVMMARRMPSMPRLGGGGGGGGGGSGGGSSSSPSLPNYGVTMNAPGGIPQPAPPRYAALAPPPPRPLGS
jgi:hypothetical protein